MQQYLRHENKVTENKVLYCKVLRCEMINNNAKVLFLYSKIIQKVINDNKNSDGSHNYHGENHDEIELFRWNSKRST